MAFRESGVVVVTFWLIVLGLLRRRRVVTVVAIASLSATALALLLVPGRYTSTATLVLTTSPTNQASTAGDPNEQPAINPLLNFNEGLKTAGAILVQSLNTDEAMQRLGVDGGPTSVTISASGGAQQLGVDGPFLYISGESTDSPEAARSVVSRAKELAGEVLRERQEELKAPPSQMIGLLYIVQPTEPTMDRATAYKAAAFVLVLALFLSLGAFYYTDVVNGKRYPSAIATPPKVIPAADPEPARIDTGAGADDREPAAAVQQSNKFAHAGPSNGADGPPPTSSSQSNGSPPDSAPPTTAVSASASSAAAPVSVVRRTRPRPALRRPVGRDNGERPTEPAGSVGARSDKPASAVDEPSEEVPSSPSAAPTTSSEAPSPNAQGE